MRDSTNTSQPVLDPHPALGGPGARTRPHRTWAFSLEQKRRSERRIALTVAAVFVVMGSAWVLFTDALLYRFIRDAVLIARIETAKGWTFVALAGLLLYAVTLRSASRLTRSRSLTSAVIESIGDGVLLLGPERTIVHANPAAVRMLRCEGLHDLLGMGAAEFSRRFRVSYPDGSLVPPDEFVSQRVFEEGGPLHYKAFLYPQSGPEIVISATAAAVREKAGDLADVVVSVMHDITVSEHLNRLRDEFFAAAAHALKTPIAVIKANAQVLARGATPQLGRSTAAIDRQCGRIDRLVQNFLVLARAHSTTLRLRPSEVELGPLVERTVREMAGASPNHRVSTELAASPRVRADQERLALVLRNLIDEGFRSSRPGSTVTVLLRRHGADAELGVRHPPLPPEERTFDAHDEYDDLAISRGVVKIMVEAHGGALREEPAGVETTTWIRLPAEERADEPA